MHREREIYNAPLTNQQMFVDQNAVDPKYKAFQQMATTTIPRVPFSINRELGWMLNGHVIAAL